MTNPNRIRRPQSEQTNEDYYNSYTSIPVIIFGTVLILGLGSHLFFAGLSIKYALLVLASFFVTLCFYRVETYYDGSFYYLRYGIGLWERVLSINEIERLDIVHNRYFSTWLFVPSSKFVVKVFIRGGGVFNIPTHEAKYCADLLNSKGVRR